MMSLNFELFNYSIIIYQQVNFADTNALNRGLVTEDVKAKDIVKENKNFCDLEREQKYFRGATLGYVTPVCILAASTY